MYLAALSPVQMVLSQGGVTPTGTIAPPLATDNPLLRLLRPSVVSVAPTLSTPSVSRVAVVPDTTAPQKVITPPAPAIPPVVISTPATVSSPPPGATVAAPTGATVEDVGAGAAAHSAIPVLALAALGVALLLGRRR